MNLILFFLHAQMTRVNGSGSGEKPRDEIQPDTFGSKISTKFSKPRIFTFSLCPFLIPASWGLF